MDSSPNSPVPAARLSATRIFAAIGVTLEWHGSNRCPSGALSISLKETTPPELDSGAFAYALPYEGTHIVVFLDRIEQRRAPQQTALVLGYVIAHEITHMLEGVCRHSDTGLMKAKWTTPTSEKCASAAWILPLRTLSSSISDWRGETLTWLLVPSEGYHGQTARTEVAR
jgi:hypothetical protein